MNPNSQEAQVEISVYYSSQDPVGPYRLKVPARRLRCVRFNDLIDAEAIPLDTDYASIIESDVSIIVQVSRLDTSHGNWNCLTFLAFPAS